MKSWKELNNTRRYIVLGLLIIMFLSLGFYIKDLNNPNNYKTIIECGNKTIELKGTGYNLEDYCPEAFLNRPKVGGNTDWLQLIN